MIGCKKCLMSNTIEEELIGTGNQSDLMMENVKDWNSKLTQFVNERWTYN
jgi:hypothetical protein